MRALRIAALGLISAVAAACWLERPNLQSTGGGYSPVAAASRPAATEEHGAAAGAAGQDPAGAPAPAGDGAATDH